MITNNTDYQNVRYEKSLTAVQCKTVEAFLRSLVVVRMQTQISVSRFMLLYRKERNGAYYSKIRRERK